MRSDTGTVWECSESATCEFHSAGGSDALPCNGTYEAKSYTPSKETETVSEAVLTFEAYLIESVLKRARIGLGPSGSHAIAAASMMGTSRQNLLLLLDPEKGRHKKLNHLLVSGKRGRPKKNG